MTRSLWNGTISSIVAMMIVHSCGQAAPADEAPIYVLAYDHILRALDRMRTHLERPAGDG